MTKKLIIMGILMIPFLLLTKMATAQNYEDMPSEVKSRMDLNKTEGKLLLDGISKAIFINVDGCGTSEKANATLGFIQSNSDISTWEYVKPGTVKLIVSAKYGLSQLKEYLKEKHLAFEYQSEYYFINNK